MSSSTSSPSTQSLPQKSAKRHTFEFENDGYSLNKLFEVGSVVHDRKWAYNLVDQAAAVEVAIDFKAKCTFSCQSRGTCRILKIVDDTGCIHGELELFIKPGAATVTARPRPMQIETMTRRVRKPQQLRYDCGSSTSTSSDTFIEATQRLRVSKKEKVTENINLFCFSGNLFLFVSRTVGFLKKT